MPLLGKAVRHEWALDWDFLSVNHGSFGAAPRVVLAAQRDWQARLEAQPGRFMRAVLPGALRHAADRLGASIAASIILQWCAAYARNCQTCATSL